MSKKDEKGAEIQPYEERQRELGIFSLEKEIKKDMTVFRFLKGCHKELLHLVAEGSFF